MIACIIVPECKIKVLKYWKFYKDAYSLQESFAMTDKSYPPPRRSYLQPLYLSVTLYACAQRDYAEDLASLACLSLIVGYGDYFCASADPGIFVGGGGKLSVSF